MVSVQAMGVPFEDSRVVGEVAEKKHRGRPKGIKAVPHHPAYQDMIRAAVSSFKEKRGSSRAAILKYICQNFKLGEQISLVNAHLRVALKRGVQTGLLKQTKGVGASGSFMLGDKKPEELKRKKSHKKGRKVKKSAVGKSVSQKSKSKESKSEKSKEKEKNRKVGGLKSKKKGSKLSKKSPKNIKGMGVPKP